LVTYNGPALKPFTRYYWSVIPYDHEGRIHNIRRMTVAWFETGMMEQANWKGSWVTDTRDIKLKPAAYFRHGFQVEKQIKSARVYIAAAGLYELSINGHRIGDHVLDPMYTRFDRRNLYVTCDVTSALRQGGNGAGENVIGVLLGNGWYSLQSTAVWYFDKAPWRGRPCFCLDLRVTYTDGTVETISSGRDWKTALSPVVFNSIYTGEHVDDRLVIPHWDEPGFVDTVWHNVIYTPAPSPHIVSQAMVPIRNTDTLGVGVMIVLSDTDYIFAFHQNIAGVTRLSVQGPAGTVIKLKHGERLYTNGHVDQSNIDVHYRPTDDSDPFQSNNSDSAFCSNQKLFTFAMR